MSREALIKFVGSKHRDVITRARECARDGDTFTANDSAQLNAIAVLSNYLDGNPDSVEQFLKQKVLDGIDSAYDRLLEDADMREVAVLVFYTEALIVLLDN